MTVTTLSDFKESENEYSCKLSETQIRLLINAYYTGSLDKDYNTGKFLKGSAHYRSKSALLKKEFIYEDQLSPFSILERLTWKGILRAEFEIFKQNQSQTTLNKEGEQDGNC